MSVYRGVPAAERTLRLLEILAETPEGCTASALAARLDVPRSALYPLLSTLRRLGYVDQPVARGPYRLGPRAMWLAAPSGEKPTLVDAFEAESRSTFEETVTLSVLEGDEVVVIAERPSAHAVRVVCEPGTRLPAEECAAGLILLAGRADRADLSDVRRQAAAERRRDDLVELAVPVCPDGHTPAAALTLHAPAFRWQEKERDRLIGHLREVAARLSHRLGAVAYRPYGRPSVRTLGRSVPLTPAEWQAFLSGPWAARLACVRPDGLPHVVPVWYEWQPDGFAVAAWPGSRWAGYVIVNPQVALTVDEPWPPLRRVLVRGQAEPVATDGEALALFRRLSARYLGQPVDPTGPGSGWRAFRIFPERISAWREEDHAA